MSCWPTKDASAGTTEVIAQESALPRRWWDWSNRSRVAWMKALRPGDRATARAMLSREQPLAMTSRHDDDMSEAI